MQLTTPVLWSAPQERGSLQGERSRLEGALRQEQEMAVSRHLQSG